MADNDIERLADSLGYAAGPGAAAIASSTARSGREQSELGVPVPQGPGPALSSLMARQSRKASTTAQGAAADPRIVAARMAVRAAERGAQLVGEHEEQR